MKRYIKVCTIMLILFITIYNFGYVFRNYISTYKENEISLVSRTNGKSFEIYKNGAWEKTFLKGVSMGAGKPGYYPGEFGITKEEYMRWFKEIKEMNGEVVRIYTLHMPEFYEALFEFNRYRKDPLYIMQGVWVDEEIMLTELDAFNSKVIDRFKNEIRGIIDVVHGKGEIKKDIARGYGSYKRDVSPYVIGYVLGVEWDPNFVYETNKKNSGMEQFNGEFIYTENGNPIEIFFANVADSAISYESEKYNSQRPVAFTNWLPTDIISHKNDPEPENLLVDINTQSIKSKDKYMGGLFASYHIYPYYPDFLNFENEYIEYKDDNGENNPYRAYLSDLIKRYDVPVIVSEFGVPTSRGIAHEDLIRGFNQGLIDEKTQGEMNSKMIVDIYNEGYAGALIFTWQDEWFKRAWNTMKYDNAERRAFWSDRMTNEKYFGLLSFDPGERKSKVYVDGEVLDWSEDDLITSGKDIKLYTKSDEAYLYLRVNKKDLDLENEDIVIPIDILPNIGGDGIEGYKLSRGWDYFIKISSENDAEVFVNEYYDIYSFLYEKSSPIDPKTNKYNSIYNFVMGNNILPESGTEIPMKGINVGKLIKGNGNPKGKEYKSLSDYEIKGDDIEIRIPYLMLNISDPSTKMVLGDFNKNKEIFYEKIEGIGLNVLVGEGPMVVDNGEFNDYTWNEWEMPTYHERLKESYYIIKETFKKLK